MINGVSLSKPHISELLTVRMFVHMYVAMTHTQLQPSAVQLQLHHVCTTVTANMAHFLNLCHCNHMHVKCTPHAHQCS